MDPVATLKAILKKHDYSLTKPRQLVFKTLQQNQPLNAARLARHLDTKIDRASSYRTLALFEKLGIVQRVWLGFKSHFELSDAFSPHHHHLTCLSCGAVVAIEDANLENNLSAIAGRYGFAGQAHHVEINGQCSVCRAAQLAQVL